MEIRRGDPSKEKHVPKLEILKEGERVKLRVSVGEEIRHPNTPEHHISWIEVYWKPPEGPERLLARAEFFEHGEPSVEPTIEVEVSGIKGGKILALSYCNLHGLWESEAEL